MVVIIEGYDLKPSNSVTGHADPYCEVSMGSQEHKTRVIPDNLNPIWDSNMQFIVRDLQEDVLCITVYDRDFFSPNGMGCIMNVDILNWDPTNPVQSLGEILN